MAQEKAPVNEVRFPATEAENPAVDSYLYVKDSDLRKTFDEFMTGEGSSNPRRLDETTKPKATATPAADQEEEQRPSSVKGLEQARTEGENMAVLVASEGKLNFPFYFPGLRKTGSRYADPEPRIYSIRDGQGKLHKAYRLVLNAGSWSEYYGVQGMTWKNPPILDDPDRVREVDGRKLELFYDGSHIRLVAWRTDEGRLLGHEHAHAVDPELATDRDRELVAAPEVATYLRGLVAGALLAVARDLHELAVAGPLGLDDGVVAGAALDGRAAAGDDRGDRVVAVAAVDRGLGARRDLDLVVAGAAVDQRAQPAALQEVVAVLAEDGVGAAAAVDRVVAGAAVEEVAGLLAPGERVVVLVAPEDVLAAEAR